MTVRTEKIQALTGSAPLTLPTQLPSSTRNVQVSTSGVLSTPSVANSLNNANLGGKEGSVEDYFYNFENDVTANFFRYSPSLMANYESYQDYYSLFNEDPTNMVYKTFPDYLVSMTPSDASEYTQRTYIDSLSIEGKVVVTSDEADEIK